MRAEEPKKLQDLEDLGLIVHVFAGKDGGVVWPLENETLEQRILRAQKASKSGDVWLTPHWC